MVEASHLAWCGTAATDGYTVYVNSDFLASMSDDDARFVIAHEYLHAILGHPDRRRERERSVWNLATDFATNQTLVEFGFQMPGNGLFDARFRGETAEAIYDALRRERGHVRRPGMPAPGDGSEGLGGAVERLTSSLTGEQLRRLVASGGWDLQLEDSDPESGARGERLTALERRQLRVSLAAALKMESHGRSAGYLADEIEAAAEPYVSWEALLAQFVGGIRRSDYRTYPFNKKHIHRGLYLPTIGAPGPEHLVVAMDTSGSVYDELASAFLAEIDSIRRTGECKLTVLHCDAAIEKVTLFEPWDAAFADDPRPTRIYGRGGTSFIPPFEWIDEQLEAGEAMPDALIYLTDGFGPFPREAPMYPVLWVLSADGTSDEHVPFGSIIRMPQISA